MDDFKLSPENNAGNTENIKSNIENDGETIDSTQSVLPNDSNAPDTMDKVSENIPVSDTSEGSGSGGSDTIAESLGEEISNAPTNAKGKKTKKSTPKKPMALTNKKLTLIFALVIMLSFGGAFGGMFVYDSFFADTPSTGSVTDDGYTLNKATGSEKNVEEVVAQNFDAVVEIRTESVQSDSIMRDYVTEGAGSGVIIKEDGYIVTNNHVIADASKIYVTLTDKKEYLATLVGTDAETDIAVLKIDAKGLTAATYGNSDELSVGDMSVVIGNPLGELGGTVTAGIISSLDRQITLDRQPMALLQTDASVNPGNSGGGMFNQYGQLIGIVVAKSSGSGVEGLGFAIPINKVADVASQIMTTGKAVSTTGYSGMTYGESGEGTIYIREVNESFAQDAGFKAGDQVISIDGTSITSLTVLSETIKSHSSGDEVEFLIKRNGKEKKITLELQSKNS